MLVISRKQNESIIIEQENGGELVEIQILSSDNQVKLGISAPPGCKIWRRELYNTVQSNRTATKAAPHNTLKGLALRMTGEKGKGSDEQ